VYMLENRRLASSTHGKNRKQGAGQYSACRPYMLIRSEAIDAVEHVQRAVHKEVSEDNEPLLSNESKLVEVLRIESSSKRTLPTGFIACCMDCVASDLLGFEFKEVFGTLKVSGPLTLPTFISFEAHKRSFIFPAVGLFPLHFFSMWHQISSTSERVSPSVLCSFWLLFWTAGSLELCIVVGTGRQHARCALAPLSVKPKEDP